MDDRELEKRLAEINVRIPEEPTEEDLAAIRAVEAEPAEFVTLEAFKREMESSVNPNENRGLVMKRLFAPGCALRAYKPHLVHKMMAFLSEMGLAEGEYLPCCKTPQSMEEETVLITCCPGCSHHFGTAFPHAAPVSLWKTLLDTDFPFPDYHGQKMTIHDACHARHRNSSEMQAAARALCKRMNIELVEPAHTLDDARCCGGSAPDFETRKEMALRRVPDFPQDNVVVYCTGCVRSFSLTPVHPRHLLDLLFEEPTEGLTVKR